MNIAAKSQHGSRTEMTEYVLPQHSNALANVFGGQIMAWVDLCGAVCAQRHSGSLCVTAFVDDLVFERPVRVGQIVHLIGVVSAVFKTSMEVTIEVFGEEATTRERWPCVNAKLTFVALTEDRKPTAVPKLLMDSEAVQKSQAEGELRREQRLARRSAGT
jgi:acyl-CoA hydrolase